MSPGASSGTRELAVTSADAGTRIDRLLARACPDLSRSRIARLIRDGPRTIEVATVADAAHRVKPGTRLRLAVPDPAGPEPAAEAQPLTIAYEDDALIVVDKPAGTVVHPAAGTPDGTLVNALLAHCGGDFIGSGPDQRRGVVHRLDKDTTGLLVVAKTPRAEADLVAQFREHTVVRRYLGVVRGVPEPPQGTITGAIGRSPQHRKKMAVLPEGGRPATTHYTVRAVLADTAASLLAFRLETGRTHQIRVHMAHAGHPLLGDPTYGRGGSSRRISPDARAAIAALGRQALHAAELGFRHPITGAPLQFTSPAPGDLAHLVARLGGELANPDQVRHI